MSNKPQWQIEIEERQTKARKLIGDLCTGKAVWRMSVPAQPDSDPDLVLAASLDDIPHLLTALNKMREELAEHCCCNELDENGYAVRGACGPCETLNFDPTKQEVNQ